MLIMLFPCLKPYDGTNNKIKPHILVYNILCDLALIYIFSLIIFSLIYYNLFTLAFFPFIEQNQEHCHVRFVYLLSLQLRKLSDKVFKCLALSFNSDLRLNTAHQKRRSLATLFFIICLFPMALLLYEIGILSDLFAVVSSVPRTMAATQ